MKVKKNVLQVCISIFQVLKVYSEVPNSGSVRLYTFHSYFAKLCYLNFILYYVLKVHFVSF